MRNAKRLSLRIRFHGLFFVFSRHKRIVCSVFVNTEWSFENRRYLICAAPKIFTSRVIFIIYIHINNLFRWSLSVSRANFFHRNRVSHSLLLKKLFTYAFQMQTHTLLHVAVETTFCRIIVQADVCRFSSLKNYCGTHCAEKNVLDKCTWKIDDAKEIISIS